MGETSNNLETLYSDALKFANKYGGKLKDAVVRARWGTTSTEIALDMAGALASYADRNDLSDAEREAMNGLSERLCIAVNMDYRKLRR